MAEPATVTYLSPDFTKQEDYAQSMAKAGFDFSAVVMGAVVKGIRDIGYKSMGTALDELIDNAIQAEARKVHVFVGEAAKPEFIAVIDNGHGMSPTMLRLSAVWGAGHHENDRTGFGKYGYGLPSACVSKGKRFTVYSSGPTDPGTRCTSTSPRSRRAASAAASASRSRRRSSKTRRRCSTRTSRSTSRAACTTAASSSSTSSIG